MGVCMPPMSPDDAYKREITPHPRREAKSDVYDEQEDQSLETQLFIFATIPGIVTSIWKRNG